MPLYIGDYLADTLHLTRDQHGGYLLLIMAYWRNGGPLPDDDAMLKNILKISGPYVWKNLRPVLAQFFQISNGFWHHRRIDSELAQAIDRIDKRSAAGKAAAQARWGKPGDKSDGKRNAHAMRTQCGANGPSQLPSHSSLQEESPPLTPPRKRRGGERGQKSARMTQAEGFLHAALAPPRHC
jgi:uncharacterized protein YdaU (DUF1376 family)